MKQEIKTAIASIAVIVFLIALSSCAPAIQIGAGMAGRGIADRIESKQSKSSHNRRFSPVPEIDTAETIIRNIGTPHEVININETGTKQIIVYQRKNWAFLFAVMYNPAKNSMIYKEFKSATYKSYLESKRDGTLKNELANDFACFHETVTEVKPDDSL